jgi:hypothetical protein
MPSSYMPTNTGPQYITVTEVDVSGGIDAASAENATPEKYVETLENVIPTYDGLLKKRSGYVTYGGGVPIRITRVETVDANTLRIYMPNGMTPINNRNVPLIITGRMSPTSTAPTGWGPFSSTAVTSVYFASTDSNPRRSVPALSSATIGVLAAESGLTSRDALVQMSSCNLTDNNNQHILHETTINTSTFAVTAGIVNGTSSPVNFFFQILDTVETTLSHYAASMGSSATWTVTGVTHGLPNNNLLIRCQDTAGLEVMPDSIAVATNGDVTITFAVAVAGRVIMVACEPTHVIFDTAASGATTTVVLPSLETPWVFADCYLQDIGGTRTRVIPDSVVVDASAETATVSFVNNSGVSQTYYIYWTCVNLGASTTVLTTTPMTHPNIDTNPSLTLYGIDQETAYLNAGSKAGWVQHLDNYTTEAEQRLVCGLGWNLYAYYSRSEAPNSLMGSWYPKLRARTKTSDHIVGPVFTPVTPSAPQTRTRGYIKFDEASTSGTAIATSLSWDSGASAFKITIPASNLTSTGTPIDVAANNHDYLTISQAPYTELIGTFPISAADYVTASGFIHIWFTPNATALAVAASNFDIAGIQLTCGIFSDVVQFAALPPFIPGDILSSTAFPTGMIPTVLSGATGNSLRFGGLTSVVFLPLGLLIAATRPAARIVQLRTDSDAEPATANFNVVRGDMLRVTGYAREMRAVYVRPAVNDTTATVVGTGTVATMSTINATEFAVGQRFILLGGVFLGEWAVASVVDATTLTFACSISGSATMTLAGAAVEFDEAIPNLMDTDNNTATVAVSARWLPTESPTSDADVGTRTYLKYLEANAYDEQPAVRSTTASDCMYFTNGQDFVMKYDGTNLYRAGLPRWQAHLFLQNRGTPGGIPVSVGNVTVVSAPSPTTVKVVAGGSSSFLIGDKVNLNAGAVFGTIVDKSTDTTGGASSYDTLTISGLDVSGGAGQKLQALAAYRYYVRLNVVDAQDNIIASATTGYDDHLVYLPESRAVVLRVLRPAAWAAYDYARFEVEVYRTKRSGVAPFYRVRNADVSFANGSAYIDIKDTTPDETLLDTNLDVPITACRGANIAPNMSPPPSGKYISSFGNRLIIANVTSPQTLLMRLLEGTAGSSNTYLANNVFTFRKDNTSTAVVTDMLNTVSYEFVINSYATISNIVKTSPTITTVTCNTVAGMQIGDWVYLTGVYTTSSSWQSGGWHQVTSVGTGTFSFAHNADSLPAWAIDTSPYLVYRATNGKNVPVFLGNDGNFGDVFGNVQNGIPLIPTLAARRLGCAINASMSACNTSIAGMETFRPWMAALCGGDFAAGEVQVQIPIHLDTSAECQLPVTINEVLGMRVYVNGTKRDQNTGAGFLKYRFPSRVCMSYKNYPEMFDNPFAADASKSDSCLDVNPDDGQEVTGVMPLFGASAYTLSQRGGTLLAFKERSVYVLSPDAKAAGQTYLQKLETNGIGCTMPYSIAPVLGGVAFANESGVYRINTNLQIEMLSYKLGRKYLEETNLDGTALELAQGHHFAKEQQYKLSYPTGAAVESNGAWVYNYRREDKKQGLGGWCAYTNIPATVWCNQDNQEFFGSHIGRVFKTRSTGELSDYRDDDTAISGTIVLRAMDFGDAAIRKQCKHVLLSFRNTTAVLTGTAVYAAINLDKVNFRACEPFSQRLFTARSVDSLRFGMPAGRFTYLQIKVVNATIDEPMEMSGVSYRVTGLSTQRTTEANH